MASPTGKYYNSLLDVFNEKLPVDLPIAVRSHENEWVVSEEDRRLTLHAVRQLESRVEVFDQSSSRLLAQLPANDNKYLFEIEIGDGFAWEKLSSPPPWNRLDVGAKKHYSSLGELLWKDENWRRPIMVLGTASVPGWKALEAGEELIVATGRTSTVANRLEYSVTGSVPCWRLLPSNSIRHPQPSVTGLVQNAKTTNAGDCIELIYIPLRMSLACSRSQRNVRLFHLFEIAQMLSNSATTGKFIRAVSYPVVDIEEKAVTAKERLLQALPVYLRLLTLIVATSPQRGAHLITCPPCSGAQTTYEVLADVGEEDDRITSRQHAAALEASALPCWHGITQKKVSLSDRKALLTFPRPFSQTEADRKKCQFMSEDSFNDSEGEGEYVFMKPRDDYLGLMFAGEAEQPTGQPVHRHKKTRMAIRGRLSVSMPDLSQPHNSGPPPSSQEASGKRRMFAKIAKGWNSLPPFSRPRAFAFSNSPASVLAERIRRLGGYEPSTANNAVCFDSWTLPPQLPTKARVEIDAVSGLPPFPNGDSPSPPRSPRKVRFDDDTSFHDNQYAHPNEGRNWTPASHIPPELLEGSPAQPYEIMDVQTVHDMLQPSGCPRRNRLSRQEYIVKDNDEYEDVEVRS